MLSPINFFMSGSKYRFLSPGMYRGSAGGGGGPGGVRGHTMKRIILAALVGVLVSGAGGAR